MTPAERERAEVSRKIQALLAKYHIPDSPHPFTRDRDIYTSEVIKEFAEAARREERERSPELLAQAARKICNQAVRIGITPAEVERILTETFGVPK